MSGFICVARNGLLENEINDILSFKEFDEGFEYDCSFSRLYDSICTFLAAGGGGYLRFFHDQLKYEVPQCKNSTESAQNFGEGVVFLRSVKFKSTFDFNILLAFDRNFKQLK